VPESYFDIPVTEQGELLGVAATETGRSPSVIEKDIWLSLVLQHLFATPNRKAMAFKGGTSLSKVYSVIKRFSEDVDVTIDYRQLGCELPLSELSKLSGRQRTQIGDALKVEVSRYTHEVVQPHLKSELAKLACGAECEVSISENGEELHVYYPSRVADRGGYMRDYVLVEFGGRNIIDPNAVHTIQPDVAELFQGVAFPRAEGVVVLAPERTFWEKVTLIHAQCNKQITEGRERISRHWYDLAMLAQHGIGKRAMNDLELLANVIDLKNVFYRSATTHYERCLAGELNLLPDGDNRVLLEKDYLNMQEAGMLNGHVYPMTQILDELSALQKQINQRGSL